MVSHFTQIDFPQKSSRIFIGPVLVNDIKSANVRFYNERFLDTSDDDINVI